MAFYPPVHGKLYQPTDKPRKFMSNKLLCFLQVIPGATFYFGFFFGGFQFDNITNSNYLKTGLSRER
jgi:hypothetical protein